MGEQWEFCIHAPKGLLIPIVVALAALVAIGAWTVAGWLI